MGVQRLLDNTWLLEAPEGVTLALHPAGLAVRFVAGAFDLAVRLGIGFFLFLALVLNLGTFGMGVWFILLFLLEWLYPVGFELYAHGATPGKRLLGLKVVHDDGTPVRAPASLVRNLLRAADFLPILYGVGVITMLSRPDFKRLGDLAAGTLVVYRNPPLPRHRLPDVAAQPVAAVLQLEEQRALIEFAERSAKLAPARLQELAALLPQLGGTDSPAGVARLLGQARKLAGEP
jgi:uncharacterized RDD family membrane protein YckC